MFNLYALDRSLKRWFSLSLDDILDDNFTALILLSPLPYPSCFPYTLIILGSFVMPIAGNLLSSWWLLPLIKPKHQIILKKYQMKMEVEQKQIRKWESFACYVYYY